VHNTHIITSVRALRDAMLAITTFVNRAEVDEALVREAGISLDRALFRALAVVERLGPIGVVDLADRIGRDHTTVSRQIAKLEGLGLVERRAATRDRRVREAVLTPTGKAMTDALDVARGRIAERVFADWSAGEISELTRLMRKFADDAVAALEAGRQG